MLKYGNEASVHNTLVRILSGRWMDITRGSMAEFYTAMRSRCEDAGLEFKAKYFRKEVFSRNGCVQEAECNLSRIVLQQMGELLFDNYGVRITDYPQVSLLPFLLKDGELVFGMFEELGLSNGS